MNDNNTLIAAEESHVPEDEDTTLRHNAPAVHTHPADTRPMSWVFCGALSMPRSEHLIPFQN